MSPDIRLARRSLIKATAFTSAVLSNLTLPACWLPVRAQRRSIQ